MPRGIPGSGPNSKAAKAAAMVAKTKRTYKRKRNKAVLDAVDVWSDDSVAQIDMKIPVDLYNSLREVGIRQGKTVEEVAAGALNEALPNGVWPDTSPPKVESGFTSLGELQHEYDLLDAEQKFLRTHIDQVEAERERLADLLGHSRQLNNMLQHQLDLIRKLLVPSHELIEGGMGTLSQWAWPIEKAPNRR